MSLKIKITFLLLVIFQGIHSIEEYKGALWEVFPPARFLCGLIADNRAHGFLIINSTLFLFGVLCFFLCLRRHSVALPGLIWFWITLELVNGIGHPLWALFQWSYTPGLATAPVLLILALSLGKQMTGTPRDA